MRTRALSRKTLSVVTLVVSAGGCSSTTGSSTTGGGAGRGSASVVDAPAGTTSSDNVSGTSGSTGGAAVTGGTSAGGIRASGGAPASTGGSASDGAAPMGGAAGAGGAADGGTLATGGTSTTGGRAGSAAGGAASTGGAAPAGGAPAGRLISFGTLLDPRAAVSAAQQLAQSHSDPSSPNWRAVGDQHRSYHFAETNTEEPYRLYIPTDWDGLSALPLIVFLHGGGANENTYVDQNGQQLLHLAQEHGFALVSPLGAQGAFGSFLRLTSPFGNEAGAAELMAQVTEQSERDNQLSEQDVVNVLELVLAEYPIDRSSMFLAGHSMGSGGTWYIGGKYPDYWNALAPMSGPFVQESGYPWDNLRSMALLVTEGLQTPSLDGSRLLEGWLTENAFTSEYEEVDADHGAMVPLVLPDVFDFFDRSRAD